MSETMSLRRVFILFAVSCVVFAVLCIVVVHQASAWCPPLPGEPPNPSCHTTTTPAPSTTTTEAPTTTTEAPTTTTEAPTTSTSSPPQQTVATQPPPSTSAFVPASGSLPHTGSSSVLVIGGLALVFAGALVYTKSGRPSRRQEQ